MSRRRSTPWIHRWSRLLIGAIAILGAVITGYITLTHFQGQEVACPTTGCHVVLSSPYAKIGNQPLSLFGILAYVSMAVFALVPLAFSNSPQKDLRKNLEEWTWLLLLMGAISMVIFSGYLMWLLFFKISAGLCIYCLASATFAVLMLLLTLFGREWPDVGQAIFTGIVVAMLAIVGTLMLYSSIESGIQAQKNPNKDPYAITTTSGPAEIALAKHLKSIDAKMYGAFWCSHCQEQKALFGKEAFNNVNYIECDPKGPKAQPQACVDAKIQSYPTWNVKGTVTTGTKPLTELGKISAYTGPQNFKNVLEGAVAPPAK